MPSRGGVVLAPSLLSADPADLASAIRAAEEGGAGALHLDVMDGHFVPNIAFGPSWARAIRRRTALPLDVHLMVEHPLRFVPSFAAIGQSTLVIHAEASDPIGPTLAAIHAAGARAGLAVRPRTPLGAAEPWLPDLDELMVMGVEPGFSGQTFLPGTLERVREAVRRSEALPSSPVVAIDGGVTEPIARDATAAGARFLVCGQSVYGAADPVAALRSLRRAVEG
ncbi:MAG: ribulose-phosphate 3-epimerase [Thermoplasmata archaeon]